MKTKIFLLSIAFLFIVKLAAAQPSIYPGDYVVWNGTSAPFSIPFSGETPTAHAVSVTINFSSPSFAYYGSVDAIANYYLVSGNGVTDSYFVGDVIFDSWPSTGLALLPVIVGFYDSTSDRMWYEEMMTGVSVGLP